MKTTKNYDDAKIRCAELLNEGVDPMETAYTLMAEGYTPETARAARRERGHDGDPGDGIAVY